MPTLTDRSRHRFSRLESFFRQRDPRAIASDTMDVTDQKKFEGLVQESMKAYAGLEATQRKKVIKIAKSKKDSADEGLKSTLHEINNHYSSFFNDPRCYRTIILGGISGVFWWGYRCLHNSTAEEADISWGELVKAAGLMIALYSLLVWQKHNYDLEQEALEATVTKLKAEKEAMSGILMAVDGERDTDDEEDLDNSLLGR